jgi:hypothetical protein
MGPNLRDAVRKLSFVVPTLLIDLAANAPLPLLVREYSFDVGIVELFLNFKVAKADGAGDLAPSAGT